MTWPPSAGAAPDHPIFVVMSGGGMAPAVIQAMQSPALAVYADGRVLTAVPAPALTPVPARYSLARIAPAAVRDFVAAAQAAGVVAGTDFGSPRMTDLPTTTVLIDDGSGPVQVRVYALDPQFETGLSPAQRDARDRLRALIARATDLPGAAPQQPYSPEKVAVAEPLPGRNDEPATVGWPGPAPTGFLAPDPSRRFAACGELSGADAEVVYRAALANPGARWLVDGTTRVLAVNPLPLDGCG